MSFDENLLIDFKIQVSSDEIIIYHYGLLECKKSSQEKYTFQVTFKIVPVTPYFFQNVLSVRQARIQQSKTHTVISM